MSTCSSIAAVISVAEVRLHAGSSASGANVATNRSVSTSSSRAQPPISAIGASSSPMTMSTADANARQLQRPRDDFTAATSCSRNAAFSASSLAIRASSSDTLSSDMSAPLRRNLARSASAAHHPQCVKAFLNG